MKEGDLTDPQYFDFLVDADVIICNNAENCFGEKINDHISMLFASMRPGTKMVTFYPLHSLGRDLNQENKYRKNINKPERLHDASFFTYQELELGKNSRHWCPGKKTIVYYYTRIEQDEDQSAFFFCYNKKCDGLSLLETYNYDITGGKFTEPHTSVVVKDNGIRRLNDCCIYCDTKRGISTRVSRTKRSVLNVTITSSKRYKILEA